MADQATTVYEIVTNRDTYRITVPSSFKVTYGPVNPKGAGGYGDDGYVLRIYEADTKQRAIFQHVQSFRDVGLPLERLVTASEEEAAATNDGKGNTSGKQKRKVVKSFQPVE